MDLAQLRTFLAAAERGSFSLAAAVVNASASSVTERIAALEHRAGAKLFVRSRSGCRLTPAGERFLPRAQAMLATWNLACEETRLPARFDLHLRIAAQYALWPELLIPWIARLQDEQPTLALAMEAGASARLSRELAAGLHDLAILYSPLLGAAVDGTEIVNDRLVMVRAAGCEDWREGWVNIDWGEAMRAPIAEAVDHRDSGGVTLNLGGMALHWLLDRSAAGYLPARLARGSIASGALMPVEELPAFDYPAFAVWRRERETIVRSVVNSLKEFIAEDEFLRTPAAT